MNSMVNSSSRCNKLPLECTFLSFQIPAASESPAGFPEDVRRAATRSRARSTGNVGSSELFHFFLMQEQRDLKIQTRRRMGSA